MDAKNVWMDTILIPPTIANHIPNKEKITL